jgi:hypothetical protein
MADFPRILQISVTAVNPTCRERKGCTAGLGARSGTGEETLQPLVHQPTPSQRKLLNSNALICCIPFHCSLVKVSFLSTFNVSFALLCGFGRFGFWNSLLNPTYVSLFAEV